MIHRVYFSPGLFGFGRLASFDYFGHLERAFVEKFRQEGQEMKAWVVDVPPTASIRRRASCLCELVSRTAGDDAGPIHLVGHSTGGLDVRLVASPSATLPVDPATLTWLPRLRSVSTLATPHFGTPLAAFFATVSGQRLLHALSAFTVIALTVGSPPLAAASMLVAVAGGADRLVGLDIRLLDRATESLLRVLDDAQSREVRTYLNSIVQDQGAVIQLTPEAMDLFQAGVEDRPKVYYQCTAALAPVPSPARLWRAALDPRRALSGVVFAALRTLTSRYDMAYPCASHLIDPATEAALVKVFGETPAPGANDGVVPMRSQLWGHLAWAGHADHLDVLGHFDSPGKTDPHQDWMTSGAGFDRARFAALSSALCAGMLNAAG
ncbi:MAG: triacylglycerol lipase [Myxococcales bacterium]